MLVPLSWLKDFAPFPDDAALLRATLDELGLVVEDVTTTGESLGDVIVARVEEIRSIEGADRIRLVVADAGDGPIEVVCGAMNFSEADLVPFAPVGSVLPGDFVIAQRKMKGVESNGMLCSGKELGLGDDHDGLMILTDVPGAIPGSAIVEVLAIEPDVIFDITVEGNRPDAHSISGVARDLAAHLHIPFAPVAPLSPARSGPPTSELASVGVDDVELCRRLVVSVASGVIVGNSPDWIQRRLEKAGMRPINNVVDASNYVMLEMGQPTHPYDLDKIAGGGLRVRRAHPNESLTTLDGVERVLGVAGQSLGDEGNDCVICDAEDHVIGIAGIMGGASSEIAEATTTILLEAASFDPIASTRTSRRLAHRTEASTRFQKGIDPANLENVSDRFFEILSLSSPSMVVAPDPLVVPDHPVVATVLEVPLERVSSLLGVAFTAQAISDLLEPLGFGVVEKDAQNLTVTIPTNRPDIRTTHHGIADVIEEVARTYGYANLPRRTSPWPEPGQPNKRQGTRTRVREALLGLGGDEAWTTSLVASGDAALLGISEPEIGVTNPLTQDEARLRRSLVPGLLRSVGYNADRRQDDIVLFEMGLVFVHPSASTTNRSVRAGAAGGVLVDLPSEEEHAALVLARPDDDATTAVAAARVLADALGLADMRIQSGSSTLLAGLHPTRSAELVDAQSGEVFGAVGEVDPFIVAELAPSAGRQRIGIVVLDLGAVRDPAKVARKSDRAVGISRFPSADLDLAFSVPNTVSVDSLLDALKSAGGVVLEFVRLFDVYRGPGIDDDARSLAFALRLSADDRTLSESEITETRGLLIAAAADLGASLR